MHDSYLLTPVISLVRLSNSLMAEKSFAKPAILSTSMSPLGVGIREGVTERGADVIVER